jgi:phage shock protein A
MRELKPLSRDAVDAALAKAERYRFLNEPGEAESICLDILAVDATNQAALITLLLALTDQFGESAEAHERARATLAALESEYDKAYYAGIIAERRAKAQMARAGVGSSAGAYDWITEAMRYFERAEWLRPSGNDDARLRWNACARFLDRHPHLRPAAEDVREIEMLE